MITSIVVILTVPQTIMIVDITEALTTTVTTTVIAIMFVELAMLALGRREQRSFNRTNMIQVGFTRRKKKIVTTTTGASVTLVAFDADVNCSHLIENVRSPETTTGFFGLKNFRRLISS